MSLSRTELEAAYRRTHYCVQLPHGELILRIGVFDADADRRLRQEAGVRVRWAIVTPCNPGSQQLTSEENDMRLTRFAALLGAARIRAVRSRNRDPLGVWPDEDGFLLCDPPAGAAETYGREFGQNAVVEGELDRAPRLVWLMLP